MARIKYCPYNIGLSFFNKLGTILYPVLFKPVVSPVGPKNSPKPLSSSLALIIPSARTFKVTPFEIKWSK